nr:1-deoxy-D-xylulose-5-phosphate synthase [Desulforegula conservatrix]
MLKNIKTPQDLKKCPKTGLPEIAAEIRQEIIKTVSSNGGHLASSLGAVELAIAIHYVFDAPRDKVIWDVGHQAYAHKLLTGRLDQFPTIRKSGGLSGFTKKAESPYDAFTTGHSSTSISAGLGMSCAKHIKKDKSKVICVIGDGSMTAGLAYEGLNQAGDSGRDLIVILNDNDMSISENVGALSSFLSRTFTQKRLLEFRKTFGEFLKALPGIGDDIYQIAKRSEESFKTFVTPGMLFEAFNFEYFGPIDGHRLNHLIDILENIKEVNEPVLLHIITRKGKGYEPAESNPTFFHGVSAFDIDSGETASSDQGPPTYTQVFGEKMISLAEGNQKIVAVTAAMPEGTGLSDFARRFPDRFFDVGIAEQHGVTFAAGLASEGLRPVVAIYSTFLQRAYDQIIHDVCIDNYPVVFAIDRGGVVGEDGPTHHGLFDFSYLRSMPNLTVLAPKDEHEFSAMLETAVNHEGPVAIRYPRGKVTGTQTSSQFQPIQIGKAEILREGSDILILAIGQPVSEAISAAEILAGKNISACVVNARSVKPLDTDLICELAAKTPRIITIEDHVRMGGFGSAVLECLADNGITGITIERIGYPDRFIEHGSQMELRQKYGISANGIVDASLRLLNR